LYGGNFGDDTLSCLTDNSIILTGEKNSSGIYGPQGHLWSIQSESYAIRTWIMLIGNNFGISPGGNLYALNSHLMYGGVDSTERIAVHSTGIEKWDSNKANALLSYSWEDILASLKKAHLITLDLNSESAYDLNVIRKKVNQLELTDGEKYNLDNIEDWASSALSSAYWLDIDVETLKNDLKELKARVDKLEGIENENTSEDTGEGGSDSGGNLPGPGIDDETNQEQM
jgi:hypothetical protein